jgi:4-hydroxy-3-methylbut-2-enyl diphosphate reductase
MSGTKKAYLAKPRGFCSGVKAAIEAVERALEEGPQPVCVLHEIVHNEHVVAGLAARCVRFVESLEEVPAGATLVFSAHGVSKAVEDKARALPVRIVDASCPLVKSLQRKAMDYEAQDCELILIGHKEHNEVAGVLGRLEHGARVILKEEEIDALGPFSKACACLTQTTLSEDDVAKLYASLKRKFPGIILGGGVCYATKDRQQAVKRLAARCELVVVVGSLKSSNSKRLKEVAEGAGAKALLISSAKELSAEALENAKSVGVTAGASAPEELVREVLALLKNAGFEFSGEL